MHKRNFNFFLNLFYYYIKTSDLFLSKTRILISFSLPGYADATLTSACATVATEAIWFRIALRTAFSWRTVPTDSFMAFASAAIAHVIFIDRITTVATIIVCCALTTVSESSTPVLVGDPFPQFTLPNSLDKQTRKTLGLPEKESIELQDLPPLGHRPAVFPVGEHPDRRVAVLPHLRRHRESRPRGEHQRKK